MLNARFEVSMAARGVTMTKRDFDPIHPGEILLTEFLDPLGISQYRLAKDIGVSPHE